MTISKCYRRNPQREFLRFLNKIDVTLPEGFEVHVVMDNYGTHKVGEVQPGRSGIRVITCTSSPPAEAS